MEPSKILLVDDERGYIDSLSGRLVIRGFDVRGVEDGFKAIEALKDFRADVVLLDVVMPGKDGVQTLREIKQNYPNIEVIILTGNADAQTAINVMELGAFDYLLKPVGVDHLVCRLNDACKKKMLLLKKVY
ncbi:MAG: response regulator [Deltaproteobacteria bacterium]|nr:response regulator [Deltaproteobacteria bacterium]